MKKRNVKSLTLNKKSISNFRANIVTGAAPNTKTYCNCADPIAEPLTIEVYCWGPSGRMQCTSE
ncbi:hypothetical protein [uncultured Kordia sp.]|uniref:hypothetical protein n=1 Tax=uncultured Kordia sp. TaxID=507699 RepID=UPI002610EC95|nr:hypothetical protein [uncultured Kordia sp.]